MHNSSSNACLDLHGVFHSDVDRIVENFVYANQERFPIIIVCGNSGKMIQIVKETLVRIGCDFSMFRYGFLTIHRFL